MSPARLINVVGVVLLASSAALLLTAGVALVYGDGDAPAFLLSAAGSAATGFLMYRLARTEGDLTVREGYAVVSLAWLAIGVAGAVPFLLAGTTDSPVAALFESVSGFTTTGATIFTDIESLPRGILFWRALTQWIGGMGIIVLGIAILPVLGIGGMQLFRAEVPGPTPERLRPRIAQTAKLLWYVYGGLTLAQAVLYLAGGLSPFDAVTHAFTTLSTGGFSARNASIAAFPSPYIQYVTIVFMYLAGMNFALHYRLVTGKGGLLADTEWKFYTILVVGTSLVVFALAWSTGGFAGAAGWEEAFRAALFQVVSIATTTGFITYDYELWPVAAQMLLLLLMLVGGMAGSTAGGMKAMRAYLLIRHGLTELKKSAHPRAVMVTRMGRTPIREDVLLNILGFVLLFMVLFCAGALALTFLGHDLVTALGASAAAIGNIGPGLGDVGAVDNYGWMGPVAQLVLVFLMLVGRLEIFTVLLLFHPDLWRGVGRRG